jgi:hypothetical protein
MSIPEPVAADILARCARHCCICRRFQPQHLIVHHIVPRGEGGSDDVDNLIAICVSCHADVHATLSLTRRFTVRELRQHRANVEELVSAGRLPGGEPTSPTRFEQLAERFSSFLDQEAEQGPGESPALANGTSLAAKVLIGAVCEESAIKVHRLDGVCRVEVGERSYTFVEPDEPRGLPEPLLPLVAEHLITFTGIEFTVTDVGRAVVDQLVSTGARYTELKVKCLLCALHFTIATWYPENHDVSTLTCPECAQSDDAFVLWRQREFGYIFERVPGESALVQIGVLPT